jgi:starch synthase
VELDGRGSESQKDGYQQFSINLANAINELVRNPELSKEMGKKGRKRAEDIFSWRSVAERTFALYRSLVDH